MASFAVRPPPVQGHAVQRKAKKDLHAANAPCRFFYVLFSRESVLSHAFRRADNT